MKIKIFEHDMYGDLWFEFEIYKSWENFLFIAEIIENNFGVKVINKIEAIGNLYEKNGLKFELAYDLDWGICLKLLEDRNRNEGEKNYNILRIFVKEIVKFIQNNYTNIKT